MTLRDVNTALKVISVAERRPYQPATRAYHHLDTNKLWLVGGNVGQFERVRRLLASRLRVDDVYSGNPDGHFNPKDCLSIA